MAGQNKLSLEEQVAELRSLVTDQAKTIESLNTANPPVKKEAKKIETPKDVFSVDKVKYRFTVPKYINADSDTVLATDSLNNPAELERLVSIKSGVVKKA